MPPPLSSLPSPQMRRRSDRVEKSRVPLRRQQLRRASSDPLRRSPRLLRLHEQTSSKSHPVETNALPQSAPLKSRPTSPKPRKRASSLELSEASPLKRARLTEHNLKVFEAMSSSKRKRSVTTSTTESDFPDKAFQNGILNPNCSKPPANITSIQERLDQSRDTASPTESEFNYTASAIRRAPNEASVLYETSTLLQRFNEPGYYKVCNQAFNNFPPDVGFNDNLSPAQPDMVEGLALTQYEPFSAREQLGGAATVYSGPEATTLPHLAGEWKGPGKDMVQAQTQAGYDGACMVYGRAEACSYLQQPDPSGHAFVHTFTTDGTTLNTFSHHTHTDAFGRVKYHQYPTSSTLLIANLEEFKKGRRRLRNQQDLAKETSERLRDALVESTGEDATPTGQADADADDPSNQLLAECWTSRSDEGGPSSQPISMDDKNLALADPRDTSSIYMPITPPHSAPIEDTQVKNHSKTRRARKDDGRSSGCGSRG